MAEFIEVMKKKYEICNYYSKCTECPLHLSNDSYAINCNSLIKNFPQKAEEIIMEWRHPVDWSNPVDWSKTKIDTPILVRGNENSDWLKRYFAKYENGKVFAWNSGLTSWSADAENYISKWEYAKLAEEGEE